MSSTMRPAREMPAWIGSSRAHDNARCVCSLSKVTACMVRGSQRKVPVLKLYASTTSSVSSGTGAGVGALLFAAITRLAKVSGMLMLLLSQNAQHVTAVFRCLTWIGIQAPQVHQLIVAIETESCVQQALLDASLWQCFTKRRADKAFARTSSCAAQMMRH